MAIKTLRLPVKLTDEERLRVALDLSAAQTALEAAEALKKAEMKEHSEAIKDLKTSVHSLNVSLSTGTVEREVAVEDRIDPVTGKSTCYRLDTNEPVNTRDLDPEERQLSLGDAPGPAPAEVLGDDAGKTEEQLAAATPDEAEQLRDARLAEEAAVRAFDGLAVGGQVRVLVVDVWQDQTVDNKTEFHFESGGKLYDASKHGVSWLPPATWADIVAESNEKARLAEIDRLAAEQAADRPKTLLKNPRKKNGADKRIAVQDEKGAVIAQGVKEGETSPGEMCAPTCEEPHQHTEQRTAF